MREISYETKLNMLSLYCLERRIQVKRGHDRSINVSGRGVITKETWGKILGSVARVEQKMGSNLRNSSLRMKWKGIGIIIKWLVSETDPVVTFLVLSQ